MRFLDAMIHIVPLGIIDKNLLSEVADSIIETFGIPAAIADPEQPDKSAYNTKRGQYSAQALMGYLVLSGEENMRILGIADVDLYVPELNFVFGLADASLRTAVISVARFKAGSDNRKLTERAVKTSIHEIAHTYGLAHCKDPKCVMFFSYSLADTDYKEKNFCKKCHRALKEKVHSAGQQ